MDNHENVANDVNLPDIPGDILSMSCVQEVTIDSSAEIESQCNPEDQILTNYQIPSSELSVDIPNTTLQPNQFIFQPTNYNQSPQNVFVSIPLNIPAQSAQQPITYYHQPQPINLMFNSPVPPINYGATNATIYPQPTAITYLQSLASYYIMNQLGHGQFSTVYKAVYTQPDINFHRIVALKKVKIYEMTDMKARQDCIKEIDLLKKLDHPNVIKCLASFVENNELNIVLELADAGDLSQMIKHFKKKYQLMPEKTIWKYFAQISDGLNHMHSKMIMHRDIKPANVFITSNGQVKLGDLGLGRFFNTTVLNSLVGTPYYMSPERIFEKPYTMTSDIWSLGCLLYEMAALHSPFYEDKMTLISLCDKIKKCSYPPLPANIYNKELRDLVSSCLHKDSNLRPLSHQVLQIAQEMNHRCRVDSAGSRNSSRQASAGSTR